MQDEINEKTVALYIKTGKLTAEVLQKAMKAVLAQTKKEHLGSDTKLRPKAWKAEVADLTAQKDRLYREMRSLKEEVAEAETVKRCVETVLTDRTIPPTEQRKEKSKTHDVSL